MIQDFTCPIFCYLFKGLFSTSSLPCLPHVLKGFAHYTVPFLLKNSMHKQDKWFKNNSHNKNKWGMRLNNWGLGGGRKWEEGWEWRHASFHSVLPLQGVAWEQQPSWLDFSLCKAPGVCLCHLKCFFSFILNDPEGGRKWERNPLPPGGGINLVKEKSQLVVWRAPLFFPSCPHGS